MTKAVNSDITPIPFDRSVVEMAYSLKTHGLEWHPRVGNFVWDQHRTLPMPSPFPERVYFVLNISRFLKFFSTLEEMQEKLVWIPTMYQALEICRQLGIQTGRLWQTELEAPLSDPKLELLRIYNRIDQRLQQLTQEHTEALVIEPNNDREWIELTMRSDIGSLKHLPRQLQHKVLDAYIVVGTAYLGWRRIQEGKESDWIPEETRFNAELLHELRHFFSDYQHIVQSLERVRRLVKLLEQVDARSEPEHYNRLLSALAREGQQTVTKDNLMEQLLSGSDQAIA